MAVFGRPTLTEFVLRYWSDARTTLASMGVHLLPWAALSPEDEHLDHFESLCLNLGWDYAIVPNEPLWEKWNGLLKAVRDSSQANCDGILVMGSDDIATHSYVYAVEALIKSGVDFVQPSGCVMFEPYTGRMSFLGSFTGGAGRVFSKRFADLVDWKLWTPNKDLISVDHHQVNLVHSLGKQIRVSDLPITMQSEWQIMDIKSIEGENMWDWEQFDPDKNTLCYWLDAVATCESAFPGYFYPVEDFGQLS